MSVICDWYLLFTLFSNFRWFSVWFSVSYFHSNIAVDKQTCIPSYVKYKATHVYRASREPCYYYDNSSTKYVFVLLFSCFVCLFCSLFVCFVFEFVLFIFGLLVVLIWVCFCLCLYFGSFVFVCFGFDFVFCLFHRFVCLFVCFLFAVLFVFVGGGLFFPLVFFNPHYYLFTDNRL